MDEKLVVTIPKDFQLSTSEMSIHKRGPSFIHTSHSVDKFEISCDLKKFARRMRLLPISMKTLSTNNLKPVETLQSQPCKDITISTL